MAEVPIHIDATDVAKGVRANTDLPPGFVTTNGAAPAPVEIPEPEPLPDAAVNKRLETIRVHERAWELNEAGKLRQRWRLPPSGATLKDDLLRVREPAVYTVERLHRRGHNNVTAAQFKVGKTTVKMNLVRCMVDGELFLGKFEVLPPRGRVGYLNYELDQDQFEDWAIAMKIGNPGAVSAWHLRGYHLPLNVEFVRDEVIRWAVDHEVTALVIDTFRQAYSGNLEDAAQYTQAVDYIKREAGIDDTWTTAHVGVTARVGEERAMGGELNAWADNLWTFTKGEQGTRYFSALGRSVDYAEAALRWDEETLSLEVVGGNRKEAAVDNARELAWKLISAALTDVSRMSQSALLAACKGHGLGNERLLAYLRSFVREEKVVQEDASTGNRSGYAYSLA